VASVSGHAARDKTVALTATDQIERRLTPAGGAGKDTP
jgi:hypothetical protein